MRFIAMPHVRFLLFLFAGLFSACIHAQTGGTVFGKIKNTEGLPIQNLNITVRENPAFKTITNEKGEYSLQLPSDSVFTLIYSHVAILKTERTVKLKPGERKKLDFVFEDITIIPQVVIEDKQTRSKFLTIIPIEVVPLQVGPSMDFNRILVTQLGVSSNNELSSGYSVRGGNYDENLVYVNGVEVYRPFLVRSGQQEGLSFVNPDLAGNVVFSGGGFEAKYGDKMSSVLDVQYRRPRKFAGTFSGSALGASLHLENISPNRRLAWIFGARQKSNQYILKSLDTDGEFRPSFYDVQGFLTYALTDEWELEVLTNIASNNYNIVPETRQSDFGTVNQALRLTVFWDGQEIDAFRSYMGAFTLVKRPTGKNITYRYIFSGFHTREKETFDLFGQYRIDALETDLGKDNFGNVAYNLGIGGLLHHARNYLDATVVSAEHRGSWFREKKGFISGERWEWGVRYQQEYINDFLSEWKMLDSAGYSVPQGNPNTIELQDVVRSEIHLASNRANAFSQWTLEKDLKDSSELIFTGGIRTSYWDLNQQLLFSPRAQIAWKPYWKRDVIFKAASGVYHQPPFYRELRSIEGKINQDLKAQTSYHFVLGSDLNFFAWGRPFKFVSEVYYKHLKNLVPYEIDNVRIRYYAQNNADGYATGIDMKINGEFVKGVESWFTMSVMQTRENLRDDFFYKHYNKDGELIIPGFTTNDTVAFSEKVEPGFIPRPTDQRVTFGLFFQDYLPGFPRCKMYLNLLFGSGLAFGPPSFERYKDTLRYPPYRRADIGFSYEIINDSSKIFEKKIFKHVKSVWMGAEIYNLFATNNTISYIWIRDVTNRQYAIPNYLTRRLINLRMIIRFS